MVGRFQYLCPAQFKIFNVAHNDNFKSFKMDGGIQTERKEIQAVWKKGR